MGCTLYQCIVNAFRAYIFANICLFLEIRRKKHFAQTFCQMQLPTVFFENVYHYVELLNILFVPRKLFPLYARIDGIICRYIHATNLPGYKKNRENVHKIHGTKSVLKLLCKSANLNFTNWKFFCCHQLYKKNYFYIFIFRLSVAKLKNFVLLILFKKLQLWKILLQNEKKILFNSPIVYYEIKKLYSFIFFNINKQSFCKYELLQIQSWKFLSQIEQFYFVDIFAYKKKKMMADLKF